MFSYSEASAVFAGSEPRAARWWPAFALYPQNSHHLLPWAQNSKGEGWGGETVGLDDKDLDRPPIPNPEM